MGACTITLDSSPSPNENWGQRNVVFGTLNLSNSYATGGDTFTVGEFALGQLDALILTQDVTAAATYSITTVVNRTGLKIQAFGNSASAGNGLVEIANNTDLSGGQYRFRFIAIGV